MDKRLLRKHLLTGVLTVLAAWPIGVLAQQQYRIAACDWMMLKRQKLGEFQLAKDIHADGVEVDMGPLGKRVLFDNKLREPHFQQLFRRTADSLGVAVPSIAMSGFFAQSFLTRENYKELVQDCLNTMDVMGATIAFLPLGGSGQEWKQPGEAHDEMVRRLREAGQMALSAGKTIAIRTQLNARANIKLLKEVDSEGIKLYYNLQDAVDQGLDPVKELKQLGRERIAQIHASLTDSVTLDRDPRIDLRQVKRVLDKMKWSGWLVVERSRNAQDVRNVRGNFGTNVAYLKEIFSDQSQSGKGDEQKENK
ncbi:MAG: sugar phosphate isomerase/epimerase [Prevotella sp.]|nr:sugar phosphate isomerase/epimerase [Prevotella sp.]